MRSLAAGVYVSCLKKHRHWQSGQGNLLSDVGRLMRYGGDYYAYMSVSLRWNGVCKFRAEPHASQNIVPIDVPTGSMCMSLSIQQVPGQAS